MIIKKFIGKTEEEATRAARESLGEGAVVLNAKPYKNKGFFGLFRRPKVEVTAAIEEADDSNISNSKPVQLPPREDKASILKDIIPEDRPSRLDLKAGEGEEPLKSSTASQYEKAIDEKLESIHSLIERQMKQDGREEHKGEEDFGEEKDPDSEMLTFIKLIYNTLIDNEVDEKYADELLDEVENHKTKKFSMDYLLSSIYQKLVLKFGEVELISKTEDGRAKAVFFIGPTGVGKTTTIAKLASLKCVNEKAKVALFTTDTYRVKAAEQLKTYADILQIPFRIIYSLEDLSAAIDEFSNYDYIMVDTAGHSPNNNEQMEAQRQFIEAAESKLSVETYLVLSITTKYRDLINIADTYARQLKYRIVFTKLDETGAFGNMLNLRLRVDAPMSYVTNGQNVPDDIEEFNAQKIVRILLGGRD
ncbi:MAG: flagellar biosynthesis protein FlhF [Lachnospiraceae bacterium]|nr:flagellar biosynthesis protein FlhF [Lachnospiraceae bacterium]